MPDVKLGPPVGSAAWIRQMAGMNSRAPRYEHEAAIVARVAQALDCKPQDVRLGWRSSELEFIGVRGGDHEPGLTGEEIAALLTAGFHVSVLGWCVPADCVGEAAKEDGEKR